AGRSGQAYMLASHRDGKYIEAIEKITGQKLDRREMMDIEVREETRPRRDDHRAGKGGRDRNRGRDGKQHDRRPPGGKFHDQVASMEPSEVTAAPLQAEAPQPAQEARAPRPEKPRSEPRPRNEPRPQGDASRPPQNRENREPREKRERGSQRQHNERAAQPEAVDHSQLPAFLFRPVPVKKPDPQE
ncbi:MAG TPA: hypothetical protein VGC16_12400, partial [Rhizomicrobium sp.]